MKIQITTHIDPQLDRVLWTVKTPDTESTSYSLSVALKHAKIEYSHQVLIIENVKKSFLPFEALYDTKFIGMEKPLGEASHRFLIPDVQEVGS